MSTPPGPADPDPEPDTLAADAMPEAETEVFAASEPADPDPAPAVLTGERRFTAPSGFDAGSTQIIDRPPDPATEIIDMGTGPIDPSKLAAPQAIPPRDGAKPPGRAKRGRWGWAVAIVLVIAALAAVAILVTVLLTRGGGPRSAEQAVRGTINRFDSAIQQGDLATLRSITCGATADAYNNYDDRQWTDVYSRVASAKRYPVVSTIDEVVVNGDHAEANVTSYMAFDPDATSTRSFDLEFRDEQWKICQAPGS
jgi:hypothetical protein